MNGHSQLSTHGKPNLSGVTYYTLYKGSSWLSVYNLSILGGRGKANTIMTQSITTEPRTLTLVATHTSLPTYSILYHAHVFVSLFLLLGVINTAAVSKDDAGELFKSEAKPWTNIGLTELEQLLRMKGTLRRMTEQGLQKRMTWLPEDWESWWSP